MSKKFFIFLTVMLSVVFSFSFCFAMNNEHIVNDAADGVRNFMGTTGNAVGNVMEGAKDAGEHVMGGAENTMENVAGGISNTSKAITGDMQNDGNDYTTTRVSTDNGFMGINSNTWSWLIIGVVAVAILALVWYYSMQVTNNNHHNDE